MNTIDFIRRSWSTNSFVVGAVVALVLSTVPVAFFVADAYQQDVQDKKVNICKANQSLGSFVLGVKSVAENSINVGLANSGINYDIVENGQNWDFEYSNGFTGAEIFAADCNTTINGSISGTKYEDIGDDGSIEGDDGMEKWKIRLYEVGTPWLLLETQITDGDGDYEFSDRPEGKYKVCEVMKDNWTQTFVTNGTKNESPNASEEGPRCQTVNIDKLIDDKNTVNFGNHRTTSVDYCDLSQKPEEMSVAQWYKDNDFDGSDCEEQHAPKVCSADGLVVSYTDPAYNNGGSLVNANRRLVSAVEAGVAPYSNFFGKEENDWNVSPLDFFSLGIEGELVYEFTNKVALDEPGDDIAIWEITGGSATEQGEESTEVWLSEDGINFELADTITADGSVDIADTTLSFVKFVKLVDKSRGIQGNNGDGFDVDAITIINDSCSDFATLHSSKIVCTDEGDLPNMAFSNTQITEDTASDWISEEHPSCELVPDWEFEWAEKGVGDPGDTLIGSAGEDWNTFVETSLLPESVLEDNSFWVREVLKENYLPFTHDTNGNNSDDVTAEMYCHTDGLNYDNFDRVDNPEAGGDYYCVAWNVPVEPEPTKCSITITSDDTNTVVEKDGANAVELSFIHSNWTTSLLNADWIWGDDGPTDPTQAETQTFVNKFGWGGDVITSATLSIAADNSFSADLNGSLAGESLIENNFSATKDFDVMSLVNDGNNELSVVVENFAGSSNPESNPAGLYYELVIEGEGEECDLPYEEPVDVCENIVGLQTEIPAGYESLEEGECTLIPQPVCEIGDNLLANGSFEEPVIRGSWQLVNSVDWITTKVDGGDSTKLEIWNNFMGGASDGNQNVELGGAQAAQVSQSVTTVPGATYELRFDFSPRKKTSLAENSIDALVDGRLLMNAQGDGSDLSQNTWTTHAKTFVAETDSTEITLSDVGIDNSVGSLADNAVLCYVADPEPVTFHLDGYKYEVVDNESNPLPDWPIYAVNGEMEPLSTTTDGDGYFYFDVSEGDWEVYEGEVTNWNLVSVYQNGHLLESGEDSCKFNIYPFEYKTVSKVIFQEAFVKEPSYQCEFYNEYIEEEDDRDSGTATRVTRRAGPTPLVAGISTDGQCPFLKDYMQIGMNNDSWEVTKLQMFLSMVMGLETPITGVFDKTTDQNVKIFQEQYKNEILDPWFERGIVPRSESTGFVYKTTLWKINSIVCPDYAVLPVFEGEDLYSNIDLD